MPSISGVIRAQVEVSLNASAANAVKQAQVSLGAPALDIPDDADGLWETRATLAASATTTHDLSGALEDAFGGTVAFTKVYAVAAYAEPGNTNDVLLGGAASNAAVIFGDATDVVVLQPGAFLLLTSSAGFPITAGTADLLKVANSGSGTSVSYRLIVLGVAA